MSETIRNLVDGALVDSDADTWIELVDPTTGEPDGRSPVSTAAEVDAAYAAASRAFPAWRARSPGQRQAFLIDAGRPVDRTRLADPESPLSKALLSEG